MKRTVALSLGMVLLLVPWGRAAEEPSALLAGHSAHGEAFNEGPRQRAYLMGGTGKVHLAVSTRLPDAQAFFDQGVGQLHGFWYFEAERSFRQVAALDPDCAMAYWGMAMANVNNPERAKGLIQKATEKKAKASPREQRWIDAYSGYWLGKADEKQRRQDLVRSLEDLSYDFPEEVEVKAFLAFHLWDNGGRGYPIHSRLAVDALLKEVLAAEPMHPVHHYRIHLWDGDKASRSLDSAARCGQSSPNVAHMWHMSGHIYSSLHRYADAAWQQEASARVDHRHMMHDRILPDQIHNYAHNNQWLVQDLEHIGRVHDAVALAQNLIELPRHPRYNTLGLKADGSPQERNYGSSSQGRSRLFETLTTYEMWDELIALCDTMYLEPTDIPAEQVKRLRALGVAWFSKGQPEKGQTQILALEAMQQKVRTERQAAADEAETKARKEKKPPDQVAKAMADALQKGSERLQPIEDALTELRGYACLARGEKDKAREAFEQSHGIPKVRLARLWLELGDATKAETLAKDAVAESEKQVQPLANYVDVLQRSGKDAEAKEQFQRLRALSAEVDRDVPVMQRIKPVAQALGLPDDWRVARVTATDVGERPDLSTLGPIHWQPSPAPEWTLPGEGGKQVALRDYRGRPVVVLFYLGNGCVHCIKQLKTFEPLASKFAAAGIAVVAVSADPPEELKKTFSKTGLSEDLTLVSDQELKVFKAYRAFDDFENVPLHGTFLIDADGRVRWQDISFEPFSEPEFLLAEARRLLSLPRQARNGKNATETSAP
jgi:peroxiredoxin/tetratricopeptide (TPR) repeat protein